MALEEHTPRISITQKVARTDGGYRIVEPGGTGLSRNLPKAAVKGRRYFAIRDDGRTERENRRLARDQEDVD